MQNPSDALGRLLVGAGVTLVIVGLLMLWGRFIKFGSLPGDFTWGGRGWVVSLPLASCIIISLILTLVLNLLARRN